ncbi:A24 family peptidase [Kordiimonas pumila]|uniref:Prepilin peptidase n=1 Tax=Kordiimonas pumila TaxID=2161677 RepID=A0ABV7D6G9_9PROT|nr:prepilin peptidase [Kordiimonas pumila]
MLTLDVIKTGTFLLIASLLVIAAYTDIKERRISNRLSIGICLAFGMLSSLQIQAGISLMEAFIYPVAAGFVVSLVCTGLFALGLMGGGDVKLLASMALVAGPFMSLSFILYTALFGGVVALVTLVHARISGSPDTAKVPYGVAISAAGLWVCLERFSDITV